MTFVSKGLFCVQKACADLWYGEQIQPMARMHYAVSGFPEPLWNEVKQSSDSPNAQWSPTNKLILPLIGQGFTQDMERSYSFLSQFQQEGKWGLKPVFALTNSSSLG